MRDLSLILLAVVGFTVIGIWWYVASADKGQQEVAQIRAEVAQARVAVRQDILVGWEEEEPPAARERALNERDHLLSAQKVWRVEMSTVEELRNTETDADKWKQLDDRRDEIRSKLDGISKSLEDCWSELKRLGQELAFEWLKYRRKDAPLSILAPLADELIKYGFDCGLDSSGAAIYIPSTDTWEEMHLIFDAFQDGWGDALIWKGRQNMTPEELEAELEAEMAEEAIPASSVDVPPVRYETEGQRIVREVLEKHGFGDPPYDWNAPKDKSEIYRIQQQMREQYPYK